MQNIFPGSSLNRRNSIIWKHVHGIFQMTALQLLETAISSSSYLFSDLISTVVSLFFLIWHSFGLPPFYVFQLADDFLNVILGLITVFEIRTQRVEHCGTVIFIPDIMLTIMQPNYISSYLTSLYHYIVLTVSQNTQIFFNLNTVYPGCVILIIPFCFHPELLLPNKLLFLI